VLRKIRDSSLRSRMTEDHEKGAGFGCPALQTFALRDVPHPHLSRRRARELDGEGIRKKGSTRLMIGVVFPFFWVE
jgi:hypothetical protein